MDQSVKLLKITQNSQSVLEMLIFTIWNKSVYFFSISDRNWLTLYKFHQNCPLLDCCMDKQFVPISFLSIHAPCFSLLE